LGVASLTWRCLHLLHEGHHYVLSADSYFFHWQAQRLLSDQDIPVRLHSGLTYPLVYATRAWSFVFGTPQSEALRWCSLLLPPVIGLMGAVFLLIMVSKMYSSRVAILSAVVWVVALYPVFITTAGYLDRDGLSAILIAVGVLIFHLSRDWHVRIGQADVGWLAGVATVLAIEALLYIEWLAYGPVLLLTILAASWAAEVIMPAGRILYQMTMRPQADLIDIIIEWLRLLGRNVWRSRWRPLLLVLAINAVILLVFAAKVGEYIDLLLSLARASLGGASAVAELVGLAPADLLAYQCFLIAAVVGVYVTFRSGRSADCSLLGWFGCLFAVAIFAKRAFLLAAPGMCILSGVGLAHMLDFGNLPLSRADLARALSYYDFRILGRYAAAGLGLIILLVGLLVSFPSAASIGDSGFVAADSDWQDGMGWLRDNTPQEAAVLAQWTFGYYILDLADRRPVVDNGLYGWDEERNYDISVVHCTTDVLVAIAIMRKYEASYVVFSDLEYPMLRKMTDDVFGEAYGDGSGIPSQLRGSVYARALSGSLLSEGGLRRVYPEEAAVGGVPLVILALDSA